MTTKFERQGAILQRLEGHAEGEPVIADGQLTYEGGYAAALQVMDGATPPDSLICLTDIMAMGAMDAIRHELKLRVPEDVAVIGFDDIPEAAYASYRLTTVRTPVRQMIRHMMALIARDAAQDEPRTIVIDAELVVRGSSRPVLT